MSDEPKKLEASLEDALEDSTRIGEVPKETLALFLEQPDAEEAMTRTLSRDELLAADAASYVPDFVPLPPPDENEETMPLGGRIDGKRLDGKEHAPMEEERTRALPKPGDQEIQVEIESTAIIVNEGLFDPEASLGAGAPAAVPVRSPPAAMARPNTAPLAFFPVGDLPSRPEVVPPPESRPGPTRDVRAAPVVLPKRRSRSKVWLLVIFVFGASAAGGYYAWRSGRLSRFG